MSSSPYRRAGLRVGLVLAIGTLLLAVPASSFGYHVGGQRWPGHNPRITYYDGTPRAYHWSVETAAAAWNSSGVRIRFVRVNSRRKAKVVITRDRKQPAGTGFATIGAAPNAFIQLNMCGLVCVDKWVMAGLTAHEFGHILGLDHETHRCALMNPVVYEHCSPEFPPAAFQWRCRILEPDDLAGARRRYGGHTRLASAQFCEKAPVPGAPSGLTATLTGDPARPIKLAWKMPARGVTTVIMAREGGTCPTSTLDPQAVYIGTHDAKAGKATSLYIDSSLQDLTAGTWCYRVWVDDTWRRMGGSATATVVYGGSSAPPAPASVAAVDQSTLAVGDKVVVTVHAQHLAWAPTVRLLRNPSTCPATNDELSYASWVGDEPTDGSGIAVFTDTDLSAGTWCYAAFLVSTYSALSPFSAGATDAIAWAPPTA